MNNARPTNANPANPVAAVTGGRRGIGRACALALAEKAFDIVLVDLAEDEEAQATLAQIRQIGRRAEFLRGDISAIETLPSLTDRMFGTFGRLDCLVNNAGVIPPTRGRDLLDVTAETFDQVMNINLRGTFFLTQEISRRMIAAREKGDNSPYSIVTVTSGAVGKPRLDSPEYAFSKTCLSLMSQAFAVRLGPHGIHTYEIRPGVTKTEMSRDAWPMYDAMIEQGRFPMGRIGLPEDVGQTVAALASGAMPYSTGDFFYVDGGFHVNAAPPARKKA